MCTFMYASVLRVFKSFRISCACDRRDSKSYQKRATFSQVERPSVVAGMPIVPLAQTS